MAEGAPGRPDGRSGAVLVLLECGLPPDTPGLPKDSPAATFPIWGNFCFLDVALANFGDPRQLQCLVVAPPRFQEAVAKALKRWSRLSAATVLLSELGPALRAIGRTGTQDCAVLSLSQASLFDGRKLFNGLSSRSAGPHKLSVAGVPLDCYYGRLESMAEVLRHPRRRDGANPEDEIAEMRRILDQKLLVAFNKLQDVPGTVLFHNSVGQLLEANLWLLRNLGSPGFHTLMALVDGATGGSRESLIHTGGAVRNSLIAQNVTVAGDVENCVIFPGCEVGQDTTVTDSVIMNNNSLGDGATFTNTLVLPTLAEHFRGNPNLGQRTRVGGASRVRNSDFADQIQGLTVIGSNADLPDDLTVEPGSLIQAGVTRDQLRKSTRIAPGSSIYPGEQAEK